MEKFDVRFRDMFDLKDKVVLVTGGGGLLGRMHSEVVVENGGKVILGDINIEAAQKVADDLNQIILIRHMQYLLMFLIKNQLKIV